MSTATIRPLAAIDPLANALKCYERRVARFEQKIEESAYKTSEADIVALNVSKHPAVVAYRNARRRVAMQFADGVAKPGRLAMDHARIDAIRAITE